MQFSVLIVNYNVRFFLEQCLTSVLRAASGKQVEVLVADNQSTDHSRSWLEPRFPQVQFFWLSENLGFGRANNYLLERASGHYIIFLNPDTLIPEDFFEKIEELFITQPNTGALGMYMLDGHGYFLPESKRGFPDTWASFCKMSGLSSLFPRSACFARYYQGHLDADLNHDVPVLSGACFIAEAATLKSCGGFDPAFFMYAEDIDLSFRIQQSGRINRYYASCPVLHFKGESAGKNPAAHNRHFYGTMLQFIQKHYPGSRHFVYRMMLSSAVYVRQWIDNVRLYFKRSASDTAAQFIDSKALVIIGNPNPILEKAAQQIGYTSISFAHPKEKWPAHSDLLFCMEGLTYRECFDYMRRHAGKQQFLFHGAGTASLVGSTSKKHPGIGIPLETA